jgi:hypothetical protein
VTFRGSKPLAIGLQLYELRDSGENDRLIMRPRIRATLSGRPGTARRSPPSSPRTARR